jgi:hypothetical protein
MLRTARAPVAVLLLGAAALLIPPEMKDLLTFILDGHVAGFAVALVTLGFSAWFWSRAVLSARFGIADGAWKGASGREFAARAKDRGVDPSAVIWVPRLVLCAAFALGIALFALNGAWWQCGEAALLGAALLLFTIIRPARRPDADPEPAPRLAVQSWRQRFPARFWILLNRAPIGRWFAILFLALGALPLLAGLVEAFVVTTNLPVMLAGVFPGPGIALFLMGLSIGPLTVATFLADGWTMAWTRIGLHRPPALTALFLYVFVVVPGLCNIHTVRTAETVRPPFAGQDLYARKDNLADIFQTWADACGPKDKTAPLRPVIVAISGGATRAGLWGAAVIDRVLRAQTENGPHLFAISSVSGGSLGAAAAASMLAQTPTPCLAPALFPSGEPGKAPPPARALAGDALGPLLAGWLVADIPRSFFDPLAELSRWITNTRANGGDSAEALEHGFEQLWHQAEPTYPRWNKPFLSLFYGDTQGAHFRPGMIIWIANGTDASTGNRVLTTPIRAPNNDGDTNKSQWPFRGARDLHTLMGADVAVSTAINNTARFPYLEPFGQMLRQGHRNTSSGALIDGGYFENEGLQTALDLAGALTKLGNRTVQPIIIEATGDSDPDAHPKDVMTCYQASDGPWIPGSSNTLQQLLAPVEGLYHVRGGHSAVLLRQARDNFCPSKAPEQFIHFYLPVNDDHVSVPLNWVLSNPMTDFIWTNAFTDHQVCNATQLASLAITMGKSPPSAGLPKCPLQ